MLGLGWTEMLVIGVVALIVIGPKDLPVVMGKVGKVIGQIQRMGREFQREINKTTGLDEVRNLRNSITSPLKQTADEIRKEFNAIGKDGSQSPTGALKPTDPKVESVVDAIHEKAGIAPKKSSTELAKEYGFKGNDAEQPAAGAPLKAPRPAASVATSDTPGTELQVKRYLPKAAAEPETATVKAAKPKTTKPKAAKPAAEKASTAAAKPKAAKPAAAKPVAEKPAAAAKTDAKPAAKPRAPRKKAAETAGKTE